MPFDAPVIRTLLVFIALSSCEGRASRPGLTRLRAGSYLVT
jgi:hypothetical protein